MYGGRSVDYGALGLKRRCIVHAVAYSGALY